MFCMVPISCRPFLLGMSCLCTHGMLWNTIRRNHLQYYNYHTCISRFIHIGSNPFPLPMTRNCWSKKKRFQQAPFQHHFSHRCQRMFFIQGSESPWVFLCLWRLDDQEIIVRLWKIWCQTAWSSLKFQSVHYIIRFLYDMSTESFQAQTEVMFCQPHPESRVPKIASSKWPEVINPSYGGHLASWKGHE